MNEVEIKKIPDIHLECPLCPDEGDLYFDRAWAEYRCTHCRGSWDSCAKGKSVPCIFCEIEINEYVQADREFLCIDCAIETGMVKGK